MQNLRKLRKSQNQTQAKLAMHTGLQQETISAYETGKILPTSENLIRLAAYFGCSTDYLLDLSNVPMPAHQLAADNLSVEEAELVAIYRQLSPERRQRLYGFAEGLRG